MEYHARVDHISSRPPGCARPFRPRHEQISTRPSLYMLTSVVAVSYFLRRAPAIRRRARCNALAEPTCWRRSSARRRASGGRRSTCSTSSTARRAALRAKAFHAALAACRQRERTTEALALLERMGSAADTVALNELLHLARVRRDFDLALAMWDRLSGAPAAAVLNGTVAAPAPAPAPVAGPMADGRSYLQLLRLCGLTGRWAAAVALLDEMRARGLETEPVHWVAVLARVRATGASTRLRWPSRSSRVAGAGGAELSARASRLRPSRARHKLAMEVLASRLTAAPRDMAAVTADHALVLQACRAADVDGGREAPRRRCSAKRRRSPMSSASRKWSGCSSTAAAACRAAPSTRPRSMRRWRWRGRPLRRCRRTARRSCSPRRSRVRSTRRRPMRHARRSACSTQQAPSQRPRRRRKRRRRKRRRRRRWR